MRFRLIFKFTLSVFLFIAAVYLEGCQPTGLRDVGGGPGDGRPPPPEETPEQAKDFVRLTTAPREDTNYYLPGLPLFNADGSQQIYATQGPAYMMLRLHNTSTKTNFEDLSFALSTLPSSVAVETTAAFYPSALRNSLCDRSGALFTLKTGQECVLLLKVRSDQPPRLGTTDQTLQAIVSHENEPISSLTITSETLLYSGGHGNLAHVDGAPQNGVIAWNDKQLVALGSTPFSTTSQITALTIDSLMNVYALEKTSSTTTSTIWKWNGSTWTSFAKSSNGTFEDILFVDVEDETTMLVKEGQVLYAAGSFSAIGDVAAPYVAKYHFAGTNKGKWAALGTTDSNPTFGIQKSVHSLVIGSIARVRFQSGQAGNLSVRLLDPTNPVDVGAYLIPGITDGPRYKVFVVKNMATTPTAAQFSPNTYYGLWNYVAQETGLYNGKTRCGASITLYPSNPECLLILQALAPKTAGLQSSSTLLTVKDTTLNQSLNISAEYQSVLYASGSFTSISGPSSTEDALHSSYWGCFLTEGSGNSCTWGWRAIAPNINTGLSSGVAMDRIFQSRSGQLFGGGLFKTTNSSGTTELLNVGQFFWQDETDPNLPASTPFRGTWQSLNGGLAAGNVGITDFTEDAKATATKPSGVLVSGGFAPANTSKNMLLWNSGTWQNLSNIPDQPVFRMFSLNYPSQGASDIFNTFVGGSFTGICNGTNCDNDLSYLSRLEGPFANTNWQRVPENTKISNTILSFTLGYALRAQENK